MIVIAQCYKYRANSNATDMIKSCKPLRRVTNESLPIKKDSRE
jgi:hypothetical protein